MRHSLQHDLLKDLLVDPGTRKAFKQVPGGREAVGDRPTQPKSQEPTIRL
jgi:hypothetical protein